MATLSIDDLRYYYYGGGSQAEMDFMQQCYQQGITAATILAGGGGGGGTTVTLKDEGVTQGAVSSLNFLGSNVVAANAAGQANITITGAGGGGNLTMNITNTPKTTNFNAVAGDYLTFDTTSGVITVTLPTAPANGTLVGGHIVTLGAGNFVGFNCGGSDVFNKAGGPATNTGILQFANQSVIYMYQAGIWQTIVTGIGLTALDARYIQSATALTIINGTDIQLDAPVGNTQPVSVLTASHNLWTPLYIRATVDDPSPVNNSNSAPAHPDPALFLATAIGTYDVDAMILYDAGNTADFRVSWSYSGTATMPEWFVYGVNNTQGVALPGIYGVPQPATALTATQIVGGFNLGTTCICRITGTLIVTVAGTLTFMYAQGTPTVENTTRKAGSRMILRKVA